MELVEDIAIIVHNREYTSGTESEMQLDYTDATVETYEDKYYEALQALFNTYYTSEPNNISKKKPATKKL